MDARDKISIFLLIFLQVFKLSNGQGGNDQGTVVDVLRKYQGLGTFAGLFKKANVDKTYEDQSSFTIFAPNNSAYDNLPQEERARLFNLPENSFALKDYIKFHTIYKQRLLTSDMQDNQVYGSSAFDGNKLWINKKVQTNFGPTEYLVNGARISSSQRDIVATNGVVHGLDSCISMTSLNRAYGYMREPNNTRVQTRKFFELTQYLLGRYENTINEMINSQRITIFVPNDAAIAAIPQAKFNELKQDSQLLDRVIRAHIIPYRVIFTAYANHNQGFLNMLENKGYTRIRKPTPDHIYVNSGGVDGRITMGNISVSNGVVHVIDTILGFPYFNVREIIQNKSSRFEQLVNRGSEELRNLLVQQSGVNVFVPANSAFDQLFNVPGVDLTSNLALVDRVLRLHILAAFQDVEVSVIIGGYESRVFKESIYNKWEVTIYTERNETWVQGGYVKAQIIRADLAATNGRVQVIDSVLGIPYLDIPMLICSDIWLLRTYDYMRAVGMKQFLTDERFTAKQCAFETYGYPPGYDYGSNTYNQQSVIQSNSLTNKMSMGSCSGCMFTFFCPNSTAITAMQNTNLGREILKNSYLLQHMFKRLLFNEKIVLENLPRGHYQRYTARTGEQVAVLKSQDRNVQIQFGTLTAHVINMDQGATNGMVHIIDRMLYTREDLDLEVGASSTLTHSLSCIVSTLVLSMLFFTI